MPTNPTPGDVHVNRPLTNVSVAYIQDEKTFIASKVFPTVLVENKSDNYTVYDKDDWLRDEAVERAPSTETAGGGYDVDMTPTYTCRVYGFHQDVDDQTVANSDKPLSPFEDAAVFVTQKLLLRKERIWASNYFTTSKWGKDWTGVGTGTPSTDQFLCWNVANSDPIANVTAAKNYIASLTGKVPNCIVASPDVKATLINHEKIVDRIKYTQRGIVTDEILASMFEVENFYTPMAIANTAAKGATANTSFIFSDKLLLCYVAPRPSLRTPSAGYTFAWKGYMGASSQGNRIKRYRMENLASDRVEGEMAFDLKLIAADLGLLFDNVNS